MTPSAARYRRSPSSAFRVIDRQVVIVIPTTQTMHTLNEVGTFLWQRCEGRTVEELVADVVDEFEVDEATARADVDRFLGELVERKMVTVE